MCWLKNTVISIGISALMAAFFSYAISKPEKFMPWFAFVLACALGNSLTMTRTEAYRHDQPEPTQQIFSGHTIHPPRAARLKEPGVLVLALILAAVLAWIFIR